MANIQHHIIRRQFIDVEMYGTESDGQSLQRTLPDFCQNRLLPAFEEALNRSVPIDGYLTIERLDIDAGTVQLERLEHDLPDMVARALVQYLQDLPQTDKLSNTLGNIQCKTKQQVINEAFLFFLKNGTLPWSFYLPSDLEFEKLIQDSLKEPEGSGGAFELFKNEVIEALSSATARKRLIRQFTPAFLESLLELISTEGKKVLDGILPLLRSSDTSLFDAKRLEQEIWECAFGGIASGSSLTEAYVQRETTAFLTAQGIPEEVCETLLYPCRSDLLSVSASSSATDDDADKEQPNVYQKRTADASVTSVGEDQSHPESGHTEPAKRQSESSSPSQQSEGVDEVQKGAHGESTTQGSVLSEREEQSHTATDNNQAQHLAEPARAVKQSEGSDEGEKGAHHQSAKAKKFVSQHPYAKTGIYTGLSGLVLLHPFLPQLFRALGIADDEKLLHPNRAIYLLYFLATGNSTALEYELVIPKILSNTSFGAVVESDIILTVDEQDEAEALLAAVIRHWEVLKNTGAEGLRETFLKRSGKLSLLDNGEWLLQIEQNACDILLEQLPWGISMIQLPWMPRILRVEWI